MIRGIFFIILSGISFFIVNFFVKSLGNPTSSPFPFLQTYPAHELVFFRSLVSFSISAYIIKQKKLPFFGVNKRLLFVRGTAGMIALTLFFFTLHELPLAIASTLQYLSPIFTVLIAALVFHEKVSKIQYFSSLIAFVGVILIAYNSVTSIREHPISLTWILVGIVSSILSGVAYNAIAKLRETEAPINIVMYFPMISLPLTGIWCMFDFIFPSGIEWLFLLFIGLFTQIAQILMTKAFMYTNTAIVAPFQYFGAIYALLSGWFIFHEQLELISIIGILVVLIAVILGTIFRKGIPKRNKA